MRFMSGCWVVSILFTNDIVCAIPLFSNHLKNEDTICSVGLSYPRVTEMNMRQGQGDDACVVLVIFKNMSTLHFQNCF